MSNNLAVLCVMPVVIVNTDGQKNNTIILTLHTSCYSERENTIAWLNLTMDSFKINCKKLFIS